MLNKLTIQNIALIDCAEINFQKGLNVLSGETGSGKSVIIESLNFVLGAKADKTLIRSGENECIVKAEFDISQNNTALAVLDELDIERDDVVIISRKLNLDGRNSIKINGNTVTVGMLRKLTAFLVDVHGQSEHFYLLKSANQLGLIDKFGGNDILVLKQTLSKLFCEYKSIKNELLLLGGDDESKRLIRLDVLDYQIKEITESDVKDGEEEQLKEIKEKLAHQEKIVSALNSVSTAIKSDGGVNDTLNNLLRITNSVANLGKDLEVINERLNSVVSELDDLSDSAIDLVDGFEFSEYNADEIESRLEIIKQIKKKYGDNYNEIQSFLKTAIEEKEKLENFSITANNLLEKKLKLEEELFDYYLELSKVRKAVAEKFSKNVLVELKELGMPKASFEINFTSDNKESCKFDSENGIDSIEFMFSANFGEPLKSMSAVISGGEISRFMLAIKAQTAKYNDVSTFIFDEIDAGISGFVAQVVAEKFAKISFDTQIIAITHLPQISAMADNNLLISKTENGQKTITGVKTLTYEEKVDEISRLIGVGASKESAKAHSQELISYADNIKNNLKQVIKSSW